MNSALSPSPQDHPSAEQNPPPPELPAAKLDEPLPPVTDTATGLAQAIVALATGTGPVAVDTERASGFRYDHRAFLIQLRRQDAGTWLLDAEALGDLSMLNDALAGTEWILHSAHQDLPSLSNRGLWPDRLFDTELAARLLNYPKVGLASLVESVLGRSLAKEHSAVDWSTRPLPEDWLHYAALDVELLVPLRTQLREFLADTGKLDWAQQEFQALLDAGPPTPVADPWRRTSGIHRLKSPQQLAALRELWSVRDRLARSRDITPRKVLRDDALVALAQKQPHTVPELLAVPGIHGRSSKREAPRWLAAIQNAQSAELPPLHVPSNNPPPLKAWEDRESLALARLKTIRRRLAELAEEHQLPPENLLAPALLKRITWDPPDTLSRETLDLYLKNLGARQWQLQLTLPTILAGMENPDDDL